MSGTKKQTSSEIEWNHDQFISKPGANRFVTYNNRVYMKILGLRSSDDYNNLTVYIDEIGISKPNPNPELFGKYDFYSGTSMSAPLVSGAVALLAAAYPKDSVHQRKARLLRSITKKASFSNKCITGGYLNLRNAHLYKAPPAKRIKIFTPSKSIAAKKSVPLSALVYPLDASVRKIKWKVTDKTFARINAKGKLTVKSTGIGKKVKVTATAKGKKTVKKSVVIRVKK
jgi:subtilisin family serine protease